MIFQNKINLKLLWKCYEEKFIIFEEEEDDDILNKLGIGDWGDLYSHIYPFVLYIITKGVMKL